MYEYQVSFRGVANLDDKAIETIRNKYKFLKDVDANDVGWIIEGTGNGKLDA